MLTFKVRIPIYFRKPCDFELGVKEGCRTEIFGRVAVQASPCRRSLENETEDM